MESTDPIWRESLFACEFFDLDRVVATEPFKVGRPKAPTVVVCVGGNGKIAGSSISQGAVYLLPAQLGELKVSPSEKLSLLEISIPN